MDRSLLYRHRDLHALVIAKAAEPPAATSAGPAVSRASLLADLASAHDRVNRELMTAINRSGPTRSP